MLCNIREFCSICWTCYLQEEGWCDAFASLLSLSSHDFREKALLILTKLQRKSVCSHAQHFASVSPVDVSDRLIREYQQLSSTHDEYFESLLALAKLFQENLLNHNVQNQRSDL